MPVADGHRIHDLVWPSSSIHTSIKVCINTCTRMYIVHQGKYLREPRGKSKILRRRGRGHLMSRPNKMAENLSQNFLIQHAESSKGWSTGWCQQVSFYSVKYYFSWLMWGTYRMAYFCTQSHPTKRNFYEISSHITSNFQTPVTPRVELLFPIS